MLEKLTHLVRRASGLHGDALGNAATSMRANRRAREHREAIEAEVIEVEASEAQPVGAGRSARK